MTRRKVKFGYAYQNGKITSEPTEAATVHRIFELYESGMSFLKIANLLITEKVEFAPGEVLWNKGKIKRIIDDETYIGNDNYPPVISRETYEKANKTKTERDTQKCVDRTSTVYHLGTPTLCGICGSKMKRRYDSRCAEKAEVIKDFEHILLFMLFVVLCVISIKIWRKLCGKFSAEIGESLRKNYFRQSVKTVPLKYILFILTALAIPALLIAIFAISDFSIYIVPKYIPDDNIFDVSHYISLIIQNANDQNDLALTGDTFLINLYRRSFSLLAYLCATFTALFIPSATSLLAI